MAEQSKEPDRSPDDASEDFGSKLKVRLGIAAVLVALALAAIPLLDNLTGKKDTLTDNGSGDIVAPATPTAASAAVQSKAASMPTASAPAAASSSAPSATAPTSPNLAQTPGMTATPPLALPKAAEQAASQTVAPVSKGTDNPPRAASPRPHASSKAFKPGLPATNPPRDAPPSYNRDAITPAASPGLYSAAPPTMASAVAQPSGSSIGYSVQLGLFSNLENAQKLIGELKSKGIEVQSETRVHLPTFRTRAEAEQAMAKLRTLGYAPMLNAPGS